MWYTYDLLGDLISILLPDDTFIEYIIDGQNRRVGKKVDGVFQKGWLYQDQLNPVVELDENGDPALGFVYGTKGHVPDFMVTPDSSYRFITDHLGSVRLVVNAETGIVRQRLEYDEFGNVIVDTNPGFQPFGYAGGLYDEETGLVRFGARDYDAETGRWTAKEPLKFADGTNFYVYSQNNPINFIDPNGRYAAIFDLENKRIYGVITERGETLWGLAKNITSEGSKWTEIDPCGTTDPHKIQIGDKFDVTGLFAPELVSNIFSFSPYSNRESTIWEKYAASALAVAGSDIIGIGVGIIATGTTGALATGVSFVVMGSSVILIAVDILEGEGLDKTTEFINSFNK